MNQAELLVKIEALETRITKITTEVSALIEAVKNAGSVTPEVEAAFARVEAATGNLDDLNPDAPTV